MREPGKAEHIPHAVTGDADKVCWHAARPVGLSVFDRLARQWDVLHVEQVELLVHDESEEGRREGLSPRCDESAVRRGKHGVESRFHEYEVGFSWPRRILRAVEKLHKALGNGLEAH